MPFLTFVVDFYLLLLQVVQYLTKQDDGKPSIVQKEYGYKEVGLAAPDKEWRRGEKKQRWAEYNVFWKHVESVKEGMAKTLGKAVSVIEAARHIDAVERDGRSVCQYMKHVQKLASLRNKAVKKKAKEEAKGGDEGLAIDNSGVEERQGEEESA